MISSEGNLVSSNFEIEVSVKLKNESKRLKT